MLKTRTRIGDRIMAVFLSILMVVSIMPFGMIKVNAGSVTDAFTFTVTDGATVIPGAIVDVTSLTSGKTYQKVTDESGIANFAEITTELISGSIEITYTIVALGYQDVSVSNSIIAKSTTNITVNSMISIPKVRVSGVVKDSSNAVLSEVNVTTTEYETLSTTTDEHGYYYFDIYSGKNYNVTFSKSDFNTTLQSNISATEAKTINVELSEKLDDTSFKFAMLAPLNIAYGDNFTNIASSTQSRPNTVVYSIKSGDAAIINPTTGTLTILKAGIITVQATLASDETYKQSVAQYTIRIEQANDSGFIFANPNPADMTYSVDCIYKNLASGGNSTGSISYAITSGDAATINTITGEVSINKAGTIVVSATRLADEKYSESTVSYELIINSATQTGFNFIGSEPSNQWIGSQEYTRVASGGQSSGSITYSITNGNAVTIDSNSGKLIFISTGTVTVKATKAGDDKYEPVEATYNVSIVKKMQNLMFQTSAPSNITFGENSNKYSNVASGGAGTGNITYSIVSGNASINTFTGEVTILKAGMVTVKATKSEDGNYLEKSATYTITINKANQSGFAFGVQNPEAITYTVGGDYKNTATGGNGLGTISYEIVSGDAATINSTTGDLAMVKSGTVTIKATKSGDDCYNIAYATYSITITRANQTGFAFVEKTPENITYNKTGNIYFNGISGGQSGGAVAFEIISGTAATIDTKTGQLTIVKAGTVTVKASRFGNECYNSITDTYSINIEKDNQKITFTNPNPEDINYGNKFSNLATEVLNTEAADNKGYGSGAINYTIIAGNSLASINPLTGTLTFKNQGIGVITVKAIKAGDECYNQTEISYTININYLATPVTPYSISGDTLNTEGWYTGEATITPKEGYEISYSNNLSGNSWANKLVVTTEGNNSKTVYLRKANATAYDITDGIKIDSSEIRVDKTNPENLEISYSKSVLDSVFETVSFGFYDAPATVTLKATDNISSIKSFIYSYTVEESASSINKGKKDIVVDISEMTVSGKTAMYTFDVDPQFRGSVSFKAIDISGRETAKYDGEILVVDNVAPETIITYAGTLNQTVDASDNSVATPDNSSRYIYDSDIIATLSINEANFYAEDVSIIVTRDSKEVLDCMLSEWTNSGDIHTRTITMKKDGDYQIKINYADKSKNDFMWKSGEYSTKNGESTYTSNIMTIDTTSPLISVSYDENSVKSNLNYYNNNRTATIQVTDRNFRPSEISVAISAVDVENNPVTTFDTEKTKAALCEWSSWKQTETQYVWETKISYDVDANYKFDIAYKDMANHVVDDYTEDIFTIDKLAPDLATMNISYSTPTLEKIIGVISFGYYKPSVKIKLVADDVTGSIDYFNWEYKKQVDSSSLNKESQLAKINAKNITYSNKGRTATAEFTLTCDEATQYRGNISFNVTDKSGNTSKTKTDDSKVIVVDTISPTRQVEFNSAKQVVEATNLLTQDGYSYTAEGKNSILYYESDVTATFKINEANFYSEDVLIKVNDTIKSPISWSQNGDLWTGTMILSGDGDYKVTMEYTDRSTNKMVSYESDKIIIDTINPTINVSYSPNKVIQSIDGRNYYDKVQTATISITEHNFRADDVRAVVTAKDVSGNLVEVIDYAKALTNRSSWVKNGDVYSTDILYATDANYTFDISYEDLAKRNAADYSEDLFTVDTTGPENLNISYSTSILSRIQESVTFGYYNAPMTVTISADDATSGVYNFGYSYMKNEGVSGVNAELMNELISNAHIEYTNNKKTATATFTIPKDMLLQVDKQFNGIVLFDAYDRSNYKTEKVDNERIVVDSIVPTATISYNNPIQNTNEIAYYAGDINATITVSEANFYSEDISIKVSKDGGDAYSVSPTWNDENADVHVGSFALNGDGNYIVKVSYRDRSNNDMESYTSNQLTIDTTNPTIIVDGISNQSANRDDRVGFLVTVQDTNFDQSSFAPVLTAIVRNQNGNFDTVDLSANGSVSVGTNGQMYTYSISNLDFDAIYSLSCKVRDMSGNAISDMNVVQSSTVVQTLNFSVNRNGSTYGLNEETSNIQGNFAKEPIDIVIVETNADKLFGVKLTLFKNEKTIILQENIDYKVVITGGNGQWYKYEYTLFKKDFADDGVYRLTIHSQDASGNIAENTIDTKNTEISFGIDNTNPNTIITNLESGITYPVDKLSVMMSINDNLKLTNVRVYLDGNDYKDWKLEDIEKMATDRLDFMFDINGDSTAAHTIKVVATDASGNETVTIINDFFVTTNIWVRYYNNKTLFFGSIAGVLFMVAGLTSIVVYKKRNKKQTEKSK